MTDSRRDAYIQRIERVCRYIDMHLDQPLTLKELSDVAAYSRHHFHRIFKAITGAGTARYIQRARLRRASYRVAFEKDFRLLDIAISAGFESHEAFARAFKRAFGQTPSDFRKNPNWPNWHRSFEGVTTMKETNDMRVEIKDIPAVKVAALAHKGDPKKVYETAGRFIEWRKSSGLSPINQSQTFGIPNGDPSTMQPDDFVFTICGSVDRDIPENTFGVTNGVIPGGRHAVVRHTGSHDTMDATIYSLYRDWLPSSGEEPADAPLFFHYLNFVHQVPERDLLTDIYLPLK